MKKDYLWIICSLLLLLLVTPCFRQADGKMFRYGMRDKAGNLWFSTNNRACRYDRKTFTDITAKTGQCNFNVNCVSEDTLFRFENITD
jgi:hypothetical protein